MGFLTGTRYPERRMRFLDGHRHHRTLGNIEIAPLVRKGAILALPDGGDDIERFLPAGASLIMRNAKPAQLLHGNRATGSHLDSTMAQDVECGDALGDAHRMVVRKRQQDRKSTRL